MVLIYGFLLYKIAVGFLKITFYSLGKVTSLVSETLCFVMSSLQNVLCLTFSEQDSNLTLLPTAFCDFLSYGGDFYPTPQKTM